MSGILPEIAPAPEVDDSEQMPMFVNLRRPLPFHEWTSDKLPVHFALEDF